jgi:chromate transporter
MIPLVKDVCVSKGWLSLETFPSLIGICESTPGPIAINMATYIGSLQAGILGSICATIGVVLPSFVIILLIASIIKGFTKNKYFNAFIKGVSYVVVSLILFTGLLIGLKTFGYISISNFTPNYISLIIFVLLIIIYFGYNKIFKKNISSVKLILISIVLGIGVSLLAELCQLI